MNFPLQLRFKKLTLTDEMRVLDSNDEMVAYVYQKIFKFKEEILVYKDKSKQQILYRIKADKIIDWSPTYTVYDESSGTAVASTKRSGARSILNATYHLMDGNNQLIGVLKERNPWIKAHDALIGAIPFVEFFTGYFINPIYDVKDEQGNVIATLSKRPAFFEGHYSIQVQPTISQLPADQQQHFAMLLMLVTIMERDRG